MAAKRFNTKSKVKYLKYHWKFHYFSNDSVTKQEKTNSIIFLKIKCEYKCIYFLFCYVSIFNKYLHSEGHKQPQVRIRKPLMT